MKSLAAWLASLGLVGALSGPALAYQRPGRVERVSVASDGTEAGGGGFSYSAGMSGDGRYVVFYSSAPNLVAGDANGTYDVFVRDRSTGPTERVSVSSDGTEANGGSTEGSMTPDGRFVAFSSSAANLVPGDTNGRQDVFVHDRGTGLTERVSLASDGTEANASCNSVAISADGRYVAFSSISSNLVPGDTNGVLDVFVHDRQAAVTERVSVASDGTEASGRSLYLGASSPPAISPDGRFVVFSSPATTLVPDDTNGWQDVFVHDRQAGVTERVSVAGDGSQSTGNSNDVAISADGRYVAFDSIANNLVPYDFNRNYDVFVHDRQTGETERVSVAGDGSEGRPSSFDSAASSHPAITPDGRYVAFYSYASNLSADDTNGNYDVFVHDRQTGATERMSLADDGTEGNSSSLGSVRISAQGRYVAFDSWSTNLVPGDTNLRPDVFVRDRGLPVGVDLSAVPDGSRISVSGWATFSGAVASAVTDPSNDAEPGAAPVGAELTGASLIYRPEIEDLVLRLRLSSLPGPLLGGAPTVIYGLRFDLGGASYEVRALRAGAMAAPPAAPYAALYRCDLVCTEVNRLSGTIGTVGREVVVSLPLSVLGAAEGDGLTGLQAFTAIGEAAAGAGVPLDEADLADASISARRVTLGIAPAGTPEHEVSFEAHGVVAGGSFSGTLDVDSLSPGEYEVWGRACLGDTCEARSVAVVL